MPHGLCNGVNTAVAKALALGMEETTVKPIYCLHELVHNEIVIEDLKALGYKFVRRVDEVPRGGAIVFSAHGVAPEIRLQAQARKLKIVDLTCPFVTQAHTQAREGSLRGEEVLVLGDKEHVEVKGIAGEIVPVEKQKAQSRRKAPLTIVCQTTLNRETAEREVKRLGKGREIASISWPCPATEARQQAVREFKGEAVLVLGSRTSANTRRLVEIAEENGAKAYLASTLDEVRAVKDELESYELVGVTSGASPPERIFTEAMRIMQNVPQHVAMIMDGNGRWATKRGKKRGEGHIAGAKTLTKVVKWCGERNIKYLTVYAFSTENWKRSKEEVGGLMKLFATMMKRAKVRSSRIKCAFG